MPSPWPIRKRTAILVAIGVVLVVVIAALTALRNVGHWLIISDTPPERLDAIVTFAGHLDRYNYSKSLAKRYPDARWLLSIDRYPVLESLSVRQIMVGNLVAEGIDTSRVTIVDSCNSTYCELRALARWLPEMRTAAPHPTLTIGLISSPYHMRRIRWGARSIAGTEGITYYCLPVPSGHGPRRYYHPSRWWRYEDDAAFVITELIKMPYYMFKY